MPQSMTQRARNAFADALVADDSRMTNTAHAIRSGTYSNVWIAASIRTIEGLLRLAPDDDDEEDERA